MMIEQNELLQQLSTQLGPEQILSTPEACANFRIGEQVPQLVVSPASQEELSYVMALAYAAQAKVVAWGAGTKQSWGNPPQQVDLVVRTDGLKRVLVYEPDDLTISVEAGMTLGELDDLLAKHGQMLPLDGPLPRRATIGGLLATFMDGPRRLGYGTARDLLIGISVVEATGRISKAGGMVVKNVSGFDMMKLYLGSLGTLAVIASANFKLIPRPRAAATVWCGFERSEQANAFVDAIHASQLLPVAVEYLSGAEQARGLKAVAVCAEGLPAAVERHVRDLPNLARASGVHSLEVLRDAEHTAFWAGVNDLPQTAQVADDEVVLRLICLPSEMGAALIACEELRDQLAALTIDARALNGVAYLRLRGEGEQLKRAYAQLTAALGQRAPSARLNALAGQARGQLPVWGRAPEGIDVMQRIKDEFDPQAILNPGRLADTLMR
jgi:FAD/FMN-containing dehydrogenases